MAERELPVRWTRQVPGLEEGDDCQVGLDVRPDGFTLVARVRYRDALPNPEPEQVSDEEEEAGAEEESEEEGSALEGIVNRLEAIFLNLADEIRSAREAEQLRQDNEALADENRQLRALLEGCVDACGRFLDRVPEASPCDGYDLDHALARAAVAGAREGLADDQPGPTSLEHRPGLG